MKFKFISYDKELEKYLVVLLLCVIFRRIINNPVCNNGISIDIFCDLIAQLEETTVITNRF